MKKIKRRLIALATLGLILIVSVLVLTFSFLTNRNTSKVTSALISNRIEAAQELITEKYYYTNTYSEKNAKDLYGWNIPFTETSYIISYDGIVSAGLDLSKLNVDVQDVSKKIVITLPEAQITHHEIDPNSFKVLDQQNSIFNPVQINDYTQVQEQQKTNIETKLIENGEFLRRAKEDAKNVIHKLLTLDPEIERQYTIEVK